MAKMDKQPVIVSVRDFFESNNTAYIVMEYVEGVTFKDLVAQRGGRIPAGSLLHTVEPLFSALSAMHSLGLLHRDISPENLMLENGEIRLLDFGCARESQGGDATVTIALKQGYAPVEQYQNKGQGPWTDVYALSATIYYCLTGQKPPQSMDRLMEDELVPPRRMGADLTEKQEKALLYGMGVRPRRRFQSVEELHTALYEGIEWDGEPDSITEEPPPSPTPPGTTGPPPAPGSTEETEPPPTGPAEEEHPGEPGKPRLPWGRGRVIGGACAAAAVILLVVVLALQPWKPRDVPVEPAAGPVEPTPAAESPAPPSSQPEESSVAPVGVDFSGAVNAESEEQLRQLMEDDAVTAIKIDNPGWNLKVMEPLEVRKPLLAKTGLHLYAPLTVDGCGLRVEQGLYGSVFVRAQNGGSITAVNEDSVQCAMLWLDNEEDLQMEGGGSYRGSVVVADEEELFKDAAHVTTMEEFEEAIRTPQAIVLEGDFVHNGLSGDPQGPVLISEGSTYTVSENRVFQDFGQIYINRGTLIGGFNLTDAPNPNTFINYGVMDVGFHFSGQGTVLNMGQWNVRSGQALPVVDVVNGPEGRIAFSNAEGGEGEPFFDVAGAFYHFGALEAGNEASGRVTIASSYAFNRGRVAFNPDFDYADGEIRRVADEAGLQAALADESCMRIGIPSPITVEGDLEINKIVFLRQDLTVNGTLTVTGNQSFLWSNANGSLQAKSLRINSHAGAIIHNAPGLESISVQDGGTLVGMDMQRAACNLEVENGGNFIAIGELALEGSEVRLGSAGCFTVCGSTTMAGCTVELEEGGSFSFHTGGGNAASVTLTGSFENQGEITSNDGTGLHVDQGGSAAGVPEELLR